MDFVAELLKYFTYAQGLLSVASASGLVKPESAAQISAVMGDIENIAKNANPPTPELATSTAQLLSDLSSDGVLQGQAVASVIAGLGKFGAIVHDVQNNQTVILDDKASAFGVKGLLMFAPLDSDQAKSVGYGPTA